MRILSLELVRYKRLKLNRIEKFVIKPADIIQLILGTNGSGKSSLIREWTPLPAEAGNYLKEGSKTIRIFHQNNNYLLKNSFFNKAEHSFIFNGEELNLQGTITVQRELVWQHFKINNEIHELLLGAEPFHSMSPSRRREWFTQMSDINYDYALGVFSRLKSRSRDYAGALRTAKKRLVAETSKVVSAAEEKKLRADIDATLEELKLLVSQSAPLDRPIESYRQEQQSGLEELNRMATRLLRMRLIAPYGSTAYGVAPHKSTQRDEWGEPLTPAFTSIEEIDDYLNILRHDVSVKETLINKAMQEHTKIDETVKILIKTGEEGVQALRVKLETLRTKRLELLSQRRLGIEGFDAINALTALETVYDTLIGTFSNIPVNEDKRFSSTRLINLQDENIVAKNQLRQLQSELAKANSVKVHLETHKANNNLVCPKCTHTWIAGYSDEKFNRVLEDIAKFEESIQQIEKAIERNNTAVLEIQQYGEFYRDYTRCVRSWPILNPFWDYLLNDELVTRSPRKALSVLETLKHDLELEIQANKVNVEIQEIIALIQSAEQVGDANLSEMRDKLSDITLTIENMTSELAKLQQAVSEYNQYRRQLIEAFDLSNKINTLKNNLEHCTDQIVEMTRRQTIRHCMEQLQHSLAIKQQTLSEIELKKGIIADLELQIKKLTIDEEAVEILVKELSPTEGLIADNLLTFIRSFVGKMNTLIRKIWAYPLVIKDCGISGSNGTELDYKFPMMVNTKDNIVSDVRDGSSGMLEIVNLAFRVQAMLHLGLSEYPLFLDEFGQSFDETHRSSTTVVIKNLMETHHFSQLVMISHYEASHGAFTNAEICVLCPSNITVPMKNKYNQHVEIS